MRPAEAWAGGRLGLDEPMDGAVLWGRNLILGLSVLTRLVKPSRGCFCGQPGTQRAHGVGLGMERQEETGEGWSYQERLGEGMGRRWADPGWVWNGEMWLEARLHPGPEKPADLFSFVVSSQLALPMNLRISSLVKNLWPRVGQRLIQGHQHCPASVPRPGSREAMGVAGKGGIPGMGRA